MADRRRASKRRAAFDRNMRKLRSSGRIKVRKSSGNIKAVTPPPKSEAETDPFQALVPKQTTELDALRQEVANLTRLQEMIHFINGAPDLHTLRSEILDLAISVSGLRRGMFALRSSSDSGKKFKLRETRGFESDEDKDAAETQVLKGILNRTLERGEALLEGCIRDEGILGHATRKTRSLKLGAVVCLPLDYRGELIGALLLEDSTRSLPFTTAEESLLRSFARHTALGFARAIERNRLKRKFARVQRRNERLEAENEALNDKAHTASERLRAQPDLRAGREMRKLLAMPYSDAKRQFTRRYLLEIMDEHGGELNAVSEATDLPIARLIGLLEHLKVRAPRRGEDGGRGWGAAVRR